MHERLFQRFQILKIFEMREEFLFLGLLPFPIDLGTHDHSRGLFLLLRHRAVVFPCS